MKPLRAAARRRAREAALQMLYQWEVGKTSPGDAILSYWPAREEASELDEEDQAFANALVQGTTARLERIDALLASRTQNWRVERMAVLDRLVLRLATYEFLAGETPAKVVINEALELTRTYSGEEAVAFVNGVLDGVRHELTGDPGAE
ncbi:transcription antitermination factor NusB [soil metagenome]